MTTGQALDEQFTCERQHAKLTHDQCRKMQARVLIPTRRWNSQPPPGPLHPRCMGCPQGKAIVDKFGAAEVERWTRNPKGGVTRAW